MSDNAKNHDREELILGGLDRDLDSDEAADLTLLSQLLGDPSMWAEPGDDLEDAVVAAVSTAEPTPVPVDGRRRQVRAQRSTGERWPRFFLAAAAAVIAIFAGAILATRGSESPDFEGELAATELAPGASASVEISQNAGGFRITLDADGLAPLGAGEHYQAWLKDDAGDLVAVGTFSSSDEEITLWSGESPERFPLLSVTLQ